MDKLFIHCFLFARQKKGSCRDLGSYLINQLKSVSAAGIFLVYRHYERTTRKIRGKNRVNASNYPECMTRGRCMRCRARLTRGWTQGSDQALPSVVLKENPNFDLIFGLKPTILPPKKRFKEISGSDKVKSAFEAWRSTKTSGTDWFSKGSWWPGHLYKITPKSDPFSGSLFVFLL